jgi:hypothetical protein
VKLSKTTWIALIVGIIVIAAVSLGWTYSQQNEQQKKLDSKLAQAKKNLAQIKFDDLNAQRDQLTLQIEQTGSQLANIKTKLSSHEDSIDATNAILDDAKNYDVDVLEMSSSGISTEDLAGTRCQTLSMVVKVQGNLQNITDFAASLSRRFPTSVEKLIQLDRLPPGSSPISTPIPSSSGFAPAFPPEKDFSANFSLVIYNYKGE